jgi:drug/metabolite transporter (DMT)-like permease
VIARASRSYTPLLFGLAAVWGASYLFIKVGVRDFEPTVLVTLRLLIAGVLLLGFLAAAEGGRKALGEVRAAWREGLVFGTINGALPFTLITWGEKHIDSSVAAVANATVPIFVALLAIKFNQEERSAGLKLAGVVLASVSYAGGGLFGQWALRSARGPVLATASMLYGGLLLLPVALFQLPDHAPGWKPVASLLGLAVGGTAIAQLILFRMLRLFGAARLSLVTYLLPGFAIVYGSLILGEPLRATMLVGLGLILGGVALGSGAWRPVRRRAPAVEPVP